MKNTLKTNGLIAVAMLIASSCSQNQSTGFSLKGNIKGVDSGMVKLIKSNEDRTTKTLDSVPLKNGTFEFNGKLDVPEMLSLVVTPGNISFRVFVENSNIKIDADTSGAEHFDYTAYGMGKGANLAKVVVKGSVVQDAVDQFEKDPEQVKYKALFVELNKQFEAVKSASIKENMRAKFDSVGKLSSASQIKYINNFVTKSPNSVAGTYLFNNYYMFNTSMPLDEMGGLLGKFQGDAKKSVYYANLEKEANLRRALLPDKLAPDFTLLKRDSTSFTLSSTRGKYIMLDFWASWCKPCREAIPHWKEVYTKYAGKGFEIISVSDDSRWGDWIKAMDFEKMPWTQVIDEFPVKNMPARVGTLYQTHFIPFYVLLDKEGKILVYSGDEKAIDSKLKELFDK